jgi:gliding motility-associated-like protein
MLRSLTCILFLIISSFAKAQDFSNKGKDFWVGYGYHQAMVGADNSQDMVLYFTSDVSATVKVEIPGVGWSKTYQVTANTVTESDPMPKSGAQDARLHSDSLYNTGIHITSDNPVVAYAHIYSSTNSGASLLFPVNTLGQEYYSLNFTQKANTFASNSWAFVIATEDNTMVEITPSVNTLTHAAGTLFTVTLNKGQVYNLMGTTDGNNGVDLTGTKIRSVSTGTGGCKRIAVFSGSGRVSINCENAVTSSDNLFQQVFPQSAWGKKFLTVPTTNLPNNYFRIAVSDPSTIVKADGAQLTGLINNFYYEITGNTPKSIVSDKPVMVAQYITSANDDITSPCGNSFNFNGDPEMIYLSPLEQTIDKITLNSTNHYQITSHYINVVIKASAVNSFTLDGAGSAAAFKTHPADPAYSYAVFSVKQGAHSLAADSGFNAIAYGYGVKESYGYNAGTNIKNLYQFITLQNPYAISNTTCSNTPFLMSVTLPYQPTSLVWDFRNNPDLIPSGNVTQNNPVADSTYTIDGRTLYVYRLTTAYNFKIAGTFPVKIIADNQSSDGCSGRQEIDLDVKVVSPPLADFTFSHIGCATESTSFKDASTGNGNAIVKWKWDFADATTDTVMSPVKTYKEAGTYNVKLTSINDIGCFSEVMKPVTLAARPVAKFGISPQTCVNNAVTFTDSSTVAGGNIVKWHWEFGEGNSITNTSNAPVIKTYTLDGIYRVSLQVENTEGCKSEVFAQDITIHPTPSVNFSMPGVCVPSGIAQFTNLSAISDGTGSSLIYLWNFGDGETSAEKDPAHSYNTAGSSAVTLRAASVFGCSKDTTKILSNIYAQPQAGFVTGSADFCQADSIHFADTSIAPNSLVNTWFWNFGDGTASNLQNPVKKYESGSYIVTLYIKSAAGCVSDTVQKTININKPPVAAFTVSASACEKQPVTFIDQSATEDGSITNRNWIFGDGTTANYQNGNTFQKSYENSGTHTIKLAVQSDKGCKSDTVQHSIAVVSSPVANFVLPKICVNDSFASFIDSSYIPQGSAETLAYSWNFGDQNASALNPNTSDAQNPLHHFSAPGAYNVSLTTTSNTGCSSIVAKQLIVNGIPQADFTVTDSAALCSNTQVQIQNTSSVSPGSITKIEITWDAGNAATAMVTDNDPFAGKMYSHTYPSLSTRQNYKIRMRAFSGISCANEKEIEVTIFPSPKVTFSAVPGICLNDGIYTITQAQETTGIAGTFVFTGNGVSPAGTFSPSAAGAGEAQIKYTYTTNDGCKDSAAQTIEVVQTPTVKLPPKVYVLEGGSVILQPEITGNVSKFIWSPGTWLSNAAIQSPTSTPPADISYRLTVSSAAGCTAYDDVKVFFLTSPIIPNAFSPNGDGINDVWNIPSLESFGNSKVQVFNRYGKIVFNSTGYRKPWDGSSNGKILPTGVYYYIINAGNGKKPYAGSLTLLK